MSQAYERFARRRSEKKPAPKFNLHKVSFDDSVDSSRSDIPNIFTAQKSEAEIPSLPMREKKRQPSIVKQESLQELQIKKEASSIIVTKPKVQQREQQSSHNRSSDQAESQQQEQIPEPQAEIEPHTSLSLFQIIKLYLGEYLFRNHFPIKKAIYINNNNDHENEINKKQFEVKFKNQEKEISHFDNSLTVTSTLLALAVSLRNVFTYFYIYAWIAILVLQSIAEAYILNAPIQYGTQKGGLIVLIIIAVLLQLMADWLSIRKRRSWQENRSSYKVYHHNGKMAEWVNIKAHLIKPGHLYTVVPGECTPTDCVLIHSNHSLVHIKENHITSCLVESPSHVVIKETLLKGESVNLPFSGYLTYQITNPEYTDFQIIGKLILEQPHEVNHPISMSQIILRGSVNYSDCQILCLAMETGIDSLMLKNLQYPFQHRKVYEELAHSKSKIISDQMTHEIKQRQSTLLGVPIEKRVQTTVFVFIFIYLFISSIGVVTNFLYRITTANQYYLSTAKISIINIAIYHFTNFIIFIPILLIPMFKLFVLLSGSIAQSNISKRPIDLVPENDKQRRTGSISVSHNEELLDNKKIIFPVKIKDHNILQQVSSVDIIVTTIDSFRDQSAFTLHSLKVKGITHNFATTALDNEIYSTEAVEEIKNFMSFAVLTTHQNQFDSSFHYDNGIELAAKKYLDLKKIKNAYGELLINNSEQFKVKPIFTITATSEYPYKVVFLQPISGDMDENPDVLVLIRGDTKTLLDKAYGKEIELTVQSRKLHQEKDFYVELMAKTSVKYSDALQIQRAYNSNSIEKAFFYRNLDKFISRIQPMGLLIFNNNFFQKKISDSIKNPVLNKSLITQYRFQKSENYDADVFASQHLPNLVILSPVSKSSQPEFQSIHTIKSLLTNSNLFNFTLSEVGDKILHEKPSNLQKMMEQLQTERVIVWNGWDQKDITYTIDILRKYGQNVLLYLQKDEYMYLMKECDCAIKGSKLGYDANKYSDINLSSRSAISFFYLTQLIKYDGIVVKQGLLSLLFTQVSKFIFYFVVEFINLYYTRGTGLAVIRTPLYLVVQVVLAVDIFYYLNWSDSMRADTFNKKEHFSIELAVRIAHALLEGIFTTFICLYSLESPPDSTGTTHSYHFTYFIIVFVFLHILLFQKLFNVLTYSFSIYKAIVIAVQIVILYIGFIIVSISDTYGYYGILWNALVGKSLITAICCIWIGLTLPAIRMLLQLMKKRKLKRGDKARKTF